MRCTNEEIIEDQIGIEKTSKLLMRYNKKKNNSKNLFIKSRAV